MIYLVSALRLFISKQTMQTQMKMKCHFKKFESYFSYPRIHTQLKSSLTLRGGIVILGPDHQRME